MEAKHNKEINMTSYGMWMLFKDKAETDGRLGKIKIEDAQKLVEFYTTKALNCKIGD